MTDALRAPKDDKDPATWSEEQEWVATGEVC